MVPVGECLYLVGAVSSALGTLTLPSLKVLNRWYWASRKVSNDGADFQNSVICPIPAEAAIALWRRKNSSNSPLPGITPLAMASSSTPFVRSSRYLLRSVRQMTFVRSLSMARFNLKIVGPALSTGSSVLNRSPKRTKFTPNTRWRFFVGVKQEVQRREEIFVVAGDALR